MKKLISLSLLIFIVSISGIYAQFDHWALDKRNDTNQHEYQDGKRKNCHKGKKFHKRQMRKMAAADGRISPRERKMLRRDRRKLR
ncbi:MAG: hypothetical protein IPO94_12675 [Saprospiraceae bacterium]|nr:hypothetical protein [Saprospiraceae bacterium]